MSYTSHSPPPLRHPVPTHPAYIPEPPSTPASPDGYQRFSSSPGPAPQQQQQHSYHVPAYTSPFQHSQQPPHHQPPPQNLYAPQHGHGQPQQSTLTPDFAAWGMGMNALGVNDATAQFGMQLGHSAVAAGQDYVQRNFGTIFPSTPLKHHFNVSNSYVMNKIRLVLFPWLQKPSAWRRRVVASQTPPPQTQGAQQQQQGPQAAWAPPREDINAPDLYIPTMALVTYILLCALHAGLQKQFHTKILGEALSRGFAVILLDFAFVKLGCYFLNVPDGGGPLVDLVAYGGYKFVGVIFALLPSFLLSTPLLNTLLFIYAFLANAFFLLRSLRTLILPDPSSHLNTNATTATLTPAARRRRIIFLFLEATAQVLYMGVLVRI